LAPENYWQGSGGDEIVTGEFGTIFRSPPKSI